MIQLNKDISPNACVEFMILEQQERNMLMQYAIDYEAMAQCINEAAHKLLKIQVGRSWVVMKKRMDPFVCEPEIFLGVSSPLGVVLERSGRLIS